MHEHSGMAPLPVTNALIHHDEQGEWGVEELIVSRKPHHPPGLVLARNADLAVHFLTHRAAASILSVGNVFGINRIIGRFPARVFHQFGGREIDDRLLVITGHRDDPPGLQISAGGRALRVSEPLLYLGFWQRRIEETPR